jgi:hypothetical protein
LIVCVEENSINHVLGKFGSYNSETLSKGSRQEISEVVCKAEGKVWREEKRVRG